MLVNCYMHKLKVKEKNALDPVVNCCIGLEVRFVQHAFDVLCINLNFQSLDPNEVQLVGSQSPEQAIELELRLKVATLSFIHGQGSITSRTFATLVIFLGQNETNCNETGVN